MTVVPEVIRPTRVEHLVDAVRDHARIHVVGAGTKSAMSAPRHDAIRCEMTGLSGVIEHQPSEFLITAFAGTPIAELQHMLRQHGQYLPFDPPLVAAGATIGGTLAAGLSGPGRLRHGGVRDFVMGARFVDGLAKVCTAGGRVVKNAAGYDIPKLLVGSCGYLAAIFELTLKVFPQPTHDRTLRIDAGGLPMALRLQSILARTPIELTAIDLEPEATLWVRFEGDPTAVDSLTQRIRSLVASQNPAAAVDVCSDPESVWQPLVNGSWAGAGDSWVRVPISPGDLEPLELELAQRIIPRRYSVAGNLAWIRWPASRPLDQLDELLRHLHLGGSVLIGQSSRYRLGQRGNASMTHRIKQALDPHAKFVGFA
jgi:glycolate oxidase FAD binding subunit